MVIREAEDKDLLELLTLYTHLHDNALPVITEEMENLWCKIMNDPNHHILVGVTENKIVSSCVLMIVPNLTHGQRPYAMIENVISHKAYRGRGYATETLGYAKRVAVENCCYKIMLMTGSKEENTLNFYRRAGYNAEDKTAFIQWLS